MFWAFLVTLIIRECGALVKNKTAENPVFSGFFEAGAEERA
jgi:hypothetical protein